MRARNIKPGFFENEELHELSIETRLIFIGLWCMADREGRLEDRPKKIKLQLVPYDSVDVEASLNELSSHGFILRYQADDHRFIQIVNFLKHQHPHRNETASVIPPPGEAINKERTSTAQTPIDEVITKETTPHYGAKGFVPCNPINESAPADSLNPDSLNPDSLNPDSLKEDLKLKSCPEPSRASEPEGSETPFIRIPLNKNGNEYSVSESQVCEFEALYPAVDVRQELREIRAWNLSNPQKRKTAAGILKHINAWLGKEQDKGGNGRNSRASPPDTNGRVSRVTEHNMAVGKRWLEKGQT